MTLMDAAELISPPAPPGSRLMDIALDAPPGWLQGLSIPFYGCGEPTLQDRCAAVNDVPHRTVVEDFHPFGISQGATCSTLSRLDQAAHVKTRLEATTEWALGRQLATDGLALTTPSFADGTDLGTITGGNIALAVATLEQEAADVGFGAEWWLHSPVFGAAYLARDRQNIEGLSPTGAPWVISPGYPKGDAPTTLRLYATGPIWVGVSEPEIYNFVNRHDNDDTAYGQREAIIAFDPCINLFIDITL